MNSGEMIERIPAGPEREEFWPLLLLAAGSESEVQTFYQSGDLYSYRADDGSILAMTLVIPESETSVELKAVAVDSQLHGRGIGQRMIRAVLDDLRSRGVKQVTVGTGSSGIGQLAFYQKLGFRLSHIERDFFSPERGYPPGLEENGIPLIDMVWMAQDL